MDAYEINPFLHELNPSEKIYWQSQPQQGLIFRPVDLISIPFTLMWCSVAILYALPFLFPLQLIPFIVMLHFLLIGLTVTFGHFPYDIKRRRNTYYALTNERAIIKSGIFSKKTRSIHYRMQSKINFKLHRNGTGTITFVPPHQFTDEIEGTEGPFNIHNLIAAGTELANEAREEIGISSRGYVHHAPSFERIENAGKVYAFIKHLQQME